MTVFVDHQIPFHDVDRLNIVWHGHYYKYLELARTQLYRSLNLDIDEIEEMGYSLPVIESNCRYIESLRYAQTIRIEGLFEAWEYYLHIGYEIRSLEDGHRIATAYTKQAVCNRETGKLMLRVPAKIIRIIEA